MKLLIYTPEITARIEYIIKLFFDSLIITSFSITTNEEDFKTYNGSKLNYSSNTFSKDELQITPWGLLTETGLNPQIVEVTEYKTEHNKESSMKVFFRKDKGSLLFDIFSAAFYLVTRYEENLSNNWDEHGRFNHTESIAFKNNFLGEPLVNIWAEELKKLLISKYPGLAFSENIYTFIPTIDIDIAYRHLGRTISVKLGSFLKAVFRLDLKTLIEKILVLSHLKKDPYDTYDYLEELFRKYQIRPIYFMLAGVRGKHDKNISPENHLFKNLVKKLSSFAEIGIHPSYQSGNNKKVVAKEIENVERNIVQKIACSRQHFIKVKFPETYRCLVSVGITDDYSMVYAGAPGFRASICIPFNFYDLNAETELPVRVHSCVIMDGTSSDYMKIPAVEAETIALELLKKVKKYHGEFIFIWHNHTFSEQGRWKGLKTVFENILTASLGYMKTGN